MDIILKYFPGITVEQERQFRALYGLYAEWNARINVISRRDFDSFYLKHVLHSLSVALFCRFDKGSRVIDVGTGGGFPAIPLAILFPDTRFTAVDSIGKKIKVVEAVANGVGLANITALNSRAENITGQFDYAVSRAVTDAATLLKWIWPRIERGQYGSIPNGIILLKGGDLTEELKDMGRKYTSHSISDWFAEDFFETKKIIYIEKMS